MSILILTAGTEERFIGQHSLCKVEAKVLVTLNSPLLDTRCNSLGVINHSLNQEATILLQSSSRWFPLVTLLTIPHRILDPQSVIKILSQTSKLLTIPMQCD